MTNQFIENLNAVCDKLGIVIDWTSDNLMPQIQDLLTRYGRYLFIDAIAGLVFGIFLLVLAVVSGVIGSKTAISMNDSSTWAYEHDLAALFISIFAFSFTIIGTIASIYLITTCVEGLIMCATIPDIYAAQKLIEMLQ